MFYIFIVLLFVHLIISIFAYTSFMPDLSTKNKTPLQIQNDRHYDTVFSKNFPFLKKWGGFFFLIPVIYLFLYFLISDINFAVNSTNILPFIYSVSLALGIMFFLQTKVTPEYNIRSFEMRRLAPNIGFSITIFVYAVSMLCSFSMIHFGNYTLYAFAKGEDHIVTISDSKHYTTRGSKGGTKHHYEIHFYPEVGGHSFIEVDSSFQRSANKGDRMKLFLKKGFFGLPYISSDKHLVRE